MIWVDYREKPSGVIEELTRLGVPHDIRELKVGDYVVDGRTFVERKTSADFVNSLTAGRLFPQVACLKKWGDRQLVILEGAPLRMIRGARPEVIRGTLVSLAVSWRLPVLFTESPEETAQILAAIQRQSARLGRPVLEKAFIGRKPTTPALRKRKILESLPQIGPALAGKLLGNFGSLEKIFQASKEDLSAVPGIGKARAEKIKDVLKENKGRYSI
jgi:Fanconi anemia group M protein